MLPDLEFRMKGVVWYVYSVPRIEFLEILKEPYSQWNIFVFHERRQRSIVWISQSMPSISEAVFRMTGYKIFASTLYRRVRGAWKRSIKYQKQFDVKVFQKNEIRELNEYLSGSDLFHVVTKDSERWLLQEPNDV